MCFSLNPQVLSVVTLRKHWKLKKNNEVAVVGDPGVNVSDSAMSHSRGEE